MAYFQATGKRKLLDILLRYLEHIRSVLGTGPGQKPGYPGHQEIELALVKLYRATGDRQHLELARYFIDQRGQDPKYFEIEAAARGDHHRWKWHRCPCCPPNIARLLASIGTYAYAEGEREIAVHLYGESEARLDIGAGQVRLAQRTRYPWDGDVEITVTPDQPGRFALSLRIPEWSHGTRLTVNGVAFDLAALTTDGYARIDRDWQPGDTVRLGLVLGVERLYANPNVRQDAGRVALRRGPLVYCLEGVDNTTPLDRIVLPRGLDLQARYEADLLDGVVVLQGTAMAAQTEGWGEVLYRTQPAPMQPVPIRAVPYFAWDNRAPGEMAVWLREEQ